MGWGSGGWGTSAWGSFVGLAPTPSVSSATVMNDGGYLITLRNLSVADGTFRMHFGPLSSTSDPICYSGVSGDGEASTLVDGVLTCVIPPSVIGGPYAFHGVRLSGTGSVSFTTDPFVAVVAHDFKGHMLRCRRLLPRTWRVGYRDVEQEDFPQ